LVYNQSGVFPSAIVHIIKHHRTSIHLSKHTPYIQTHTPLIDTFKEKGEKEEGERRRRKE
jgi:hypothetical protein